MFTEFVFELSFSNFTFDGGSFVAVYTILECAALCLNSKDCLSFFYSHNKRSCSVTPAGYLDMSGLTPQGGVNYYSMLFGFGMQCSSTADCSCKKCICSQGSCGCAVGYSYQPSIGSCVMGCSEYGDRFEMYPQNAVIGCNVRTIEGINGKACLEACRDETSFICINVDYSESHALCTLCDTAWFDLPAQTRGMNIVGWEIYYRQCE